MAREGGIVVSPKLLYPLLAVAAGGVSGGGISVISGDSVAGQISELKTSMGVRLAVMETKLDSSKAEASELRSAVQNGTRDRYTVEDAARDRAVLNAAIDGMRDRVVSLEAYVRANSLAIAELRALMGEKTVKNPG